MSGMSQALEDGCGTEQHVPHHTVKYNFLLVQLVSRFVDTERLFTQQNQILFCDVVAESCSPAFEVGYTLTHTSLFQIFEKSSKFESEHWVRKPS